MERLSYETALALKEAGFPQSGEGVGVYPTGEIVRIPWMPSSPNNASVYVPHTLELIAASRVQHLKRDPIVGWYADWCIGPTPDEALARLFIDRAREDGLD